MDIFEVRKQMRTKSIYDIPMRVTFYARVSSEKDEQLNSLSNQIDYYRNFIKSNKSWTFVDGYIDEGITGISTAKRESFHRMIDDAKHGDFDLIITKEISRFARNTVDSIQYTRDLLSMGVGVFFQNDNLNTLDEDSELRLTIMSGIAQDELRKLSSRVKFGHQQAIKNNVVLGNSRIFGYKKENKRLVIDEDEAVMVRELFELYASYEYSMKQIEDLFWAKGYRNHNGNRISHSTMSNTIKNPKYKGYYVGNKVKVIDMFTKKQKFLPPEEWVMFKDETGDIVPAIVSEELWDKANTILERRSHDVRDRQNKSNHNNLLTGKLYCTHCGCAYYRKDSKDRHGNINSRWVCSGKIKNGADSCPSVSLYEEEIKPVLLDVFKSTSDDCERIIEEYIQMFSSLEEVNSVAKEIESTKAKIDMCVKKKSKLLEYNITGKISDNDFVMMNSEAEKDLLDAQRYLQELEDRQNSKKEFSDRIAEIRKVLHDAESDAKDGIITKSFVNKYIDKIFVTVDNDEKIQLQIRIFTGKDTIAYLEKLRGRTGHIMKKMIESYEQSLK
ncbi:MAG: recombinase family protein [Clostridia bacterium]|nr:recombinase family protein [Clostridia bacterium]